MNNVDVARYVPMGLVIGVIGYCLWPYLSGPPQTFDTKPAAKTSEITKAMLTGPVVPLPEHDPFHPGNVRQNARSTASSDAVRVGGARSAFAVQRKVDPFQGLVLEATCISPGLRLATINGHVYHQSDTMRPAAVGAPSCVLTKVLHDRVIIKADGKTRELQYSNTAKKPTTNPSGHARP